MAKVKSDFAQNALRVVEEATQSKLSEQISASSEDQVRRFMREMGRRGGRKGGPARAAALSEEERSASAAKAARARWSKETAKE